MNTAKPAEARRLANRLAVRWDEVAMYAGHDIERGTLTRDEQRTLFRKALEEELLHVTRASLPTRREVGHPSTHKILAAAYEVVRRVPPDAKSISADDIDSVVNATWSDEERSLLIKTLRLMITPDTVGWGAASRALNEIGAPINNGTLNETRSTILRGRIEAQNRARLSEHPLITATGDPAYYLADDTLVAEARKSPFARASAPTQPENPLFAETTTVRFSAQIDDLEATMFQLNGWQSDNGKTRLILETFAWLTGDKVMSDYRPADITIYVQNLGRIPTGFLWGKFGESGGMASLFDSRSFPKDPKGLPADKRRSARTINSHLTKMAAASEILKKSFWLPKAGYGNVMDFQDCRLKVDVDPASPKRVPWTPEHLRVMYGLPLWQGSGGANHRVKASPTPTIYQDAAYWVPLIGTYTGLAREEACGLEVIDFNFECSIPYLLVQANMTRSKDGVTKAGLKRPSRYRAMPIHPELSRLGLKEYVEAIAAEGHEMIFPELYVAEAKAGKKDATRPATGGRRFYAIAWCFIMDAAHAIEPLPETDEGKKADFHSQRTYNNSVLASPEVSETLIADHMGHARRGTGARNYNRRALTLGQGKELQERLQMIIKQMPVVTEHISRTKAVNLLHIAKRSRVGSAEGRSAKAKFCA